MAEANVEGTDAERRKAGATMSEDIQRAKAEALVARVQVKINAGDDVREWSENELAAAVQADPRWAQSNAIPEMRRRQAEARAERLEREHDENVRRLQFEAAEDTRLRAEAQAERDKMWQDVKREFARLDEAGLRDYGRRLATMDAGRWMRDVGERLIQERAEERAQAERARIEAQVRNRVEAGNPPVADPNAFRPINPRGGLPPRRHH